jgi:hypothetical protein
MADARREDLRTRLEALLASTADRGTLLREMDALAGEAGFEDSADVWALALYQRDAYFFETFLLRHLDNEHEDIIRALLPRAEASGQDTLFLGLYHKIADEDAWNRDLLALAQAAEPDDVVSRAVLRREPGSMGFTLSEDAALALYTRNPALFASFVRDHVKRQSGEHGSYERLRAEIKRHGDDALYWALYRALADQSEWTAELRQLLRERVPTDAIADELRKRHPHHGWNLDVAILADFVAKYGAAVVPYLEEHLDAIDRRSASRLLPAIEWTGDEALYWRLIFKAGEVKHWNRALRDLLTQPLTDDALLAALQRRTPPAQQRTRWRLDDEIAADLYQRNPGLFRPFLERCVELTNLALFQAAERNGDEDFLDFLTARLMRQMSSLVVAAYPTQAQQEWRKPDSRAREQLDQLGQAVAARFDRLFAHAPDDYVRHAATVLSRFEPLETWSLWRDLEHNPALDYLFHQHREAWRHSSDAMRELLESPNVAIQTIGLAILSEGGEEAAQRTIENVPLLRALLLGRAGRNTKKLALRCLEQAGRQTATFADQIGPVLADALYFRGKLAIDERIMVSCVRLKALWPRRPAPQTTV